MNKRQKLVTYFMARQYERKKPLFYEPCEMNDCVTSDRDHDDGNKTAEWVTYPKEDLSTWGIR